MSNNNLVIRWLDASEYDAWNDLNRESISGSIYTSTPYLQILSEAAGGTFRVLGAFKGEELFGGVTLYQQEARMGRSYVSPRSLLRYNGIVLRRFDSRYPSNEYSRTLSVVSDLEPQIRAAGLAMVSLRCLNFIDLRPLKEAGWVFTPDYTLTVDISDIDVARQRVAQNLRRLIKRGEEAGLQIKQDEDFDSLYRFHLGTHKRKNAELYLPEAAYRRFFAGLRETGLGRLYHACLSDGTPVASQLVLLGRFETSHTVCASADPAHTNLGSNVFLRWKVLEDSASMGYKMHDLTGAELDTVSKFKSQLGANLSYSLRVRWPGKSASPFDRGTQLARRVARKMLRHG